MDRRAFLQARGSRAMAGPESAKLFGFRSSEMERKRQGDIGEIEASFAMRGCFVVCGRFARRSHKTGYWFRMAGDDRVVLVWLGDSWLFGLGGCLRSAKWMGGSWLGWVRCGRGMAGFITLATQC